MPGEAQRVLWCLRKIARWENMSKREFTEAGIQMLMEKSLFETIEDCRGFLENAWDEMRKEDFKHAHTITG